jgi:hypothetical protein
MASTSTDGGVSWEPSFPVSDLNNPFDPDVAPPGQPPETQQNEGTTRIGDYFGVAVSNGTAYAAWNGSFFDSGNPNGNKQHAYFDSFPMAHGSLELDGTSGPDTILVQSPPGNPNVVEMSLDGVRQYTGLWSSLESLTVKAGAGDDSIDIESSVANLQYSVDAGDGSDLVQISPIARNLANIQGSLGIDGGPGLADRIIFSDQDGPLHGLSANYTLAGTPDNPTLQRDASALITYHNFNAGIEIDGSNHNDFFQVLTTSRFSEPTALSGGSGDDGFNVKGTAGPLVIHPLAGTNTISIGDGTPITSTINGIHGALTVDGFLGNDTLNVRDQSNFADPARSYTLTATTLTRSGSPGPIPPITFNEVENRNFLLSGGVVNVQGTAAGTTTVAAGGGDSQVFVGDATNSLDAIQGVLSIDGQGGANTLTVNDRAAPATNPPRVYTLTTTGFTRTASNLPTTTVNTTGFQNTSFNASGTVNVQATKAGTSTTIDSGVLNAISGNQINLGSQGTLQAIQGAVTVASHVPTSLPDVLLNDAFDTASHTVSVGPAGITGLSAPVNLTAASVGELLIIGSANTTTGSTYTITATPASKTFQVNANGHDIVTLHGATVPTAFSGQGATALIVNDLGSPTGPAQTATITPTSYTRTGGATPAQNIVLLGGLLTEVFNTSGTVNVLGTAAGTSTAVNTGNCNDQVYVGSTTDILTATLDSIQGPLTIDGQGGINYLELRDKGTTTKHSYTLTASGAFITEQRSPGAAPITFTNIGPMSTNPLVGFMLDRGPVGGINLPMATGLALSGPIRAGGHATLSGRLVDRDKGDKLSLAVDWGDGSATDQSRPDRKLFSRKHSYAKAGTYTVRAIWTDSTGLSNFRDLSLVVTPSHLPKGPRAARHHRA